MKIVGLMVLTLLLVSETSFAKPKCTGNMFTKLDTGEISFEKVKFAPTPSFQETLTIKEINGRPFINFEKKSDEWAYYTYIDQEQMMRSGYRGRPPGFQYSDFNFDRESFFKFKDQAIVGFRLFCRM